MTDDIQDGGLDRRTVLRRGAILGGAMVWTVPTVQSLAGPAFAIGTAEICQVILAGRVDAYGTFTETSSAGVVRNDRTARVDLYDQESFDINSEVTGQHVLVQSRNAANTAAGATTWRFLIDSVGSTSNDTDQCPETVTINGTGTSGTSSAFKLTAVITYPNTPNPTGPTSVSVTVTRTGGPFATRFTGTGAPTSPLNTLSRTCIGCSSSVPARPAP